MAELIWTGLYLGVCEINPKHRFHCDGLGKSNFAKNRPGQLIGINKVCCGRPIKFEKVMRDLDPKKGRKRAKK
jgi:hypothetical protein